MTPETAALWGVVFAVLTLAATLFFKGPKEMNGDLLREIVKLAREIRELRIAQQLNAEKVARHDERIASMTAKLTEVSAKLDTWISRQNGFRFGG